MLLVTSLLIILFYFLFVSHVKEEKEVQIPGEQVWTPSYSSHRCYFLWWFAHRFLIVFKLYSLLSQLLWKTWWNRSLQLFPLVAQWSRINLHCRRPSAMQETFCNAGDSGSIPGLGRSPGERNGNPLQYSGLGNPRGKEAWWAIVHSFARAGHNLATKPLNQYPALVSANCLE